MLLKNSMKNSCKDLYLANHIHIWCQFPAVTRQIRQPTLFPIWTLQKQLKIYLLFEKSLKISCNNLYFHFYTIDMGCKSFSYLTSFSRRGPVNLSTPTFGNINLTEKMVNVIVDWKFNQKWLQESLFSP